MANPRKPVALKLVSGTLQKCREPPAESAIEVPALDDVPEPPDWLPNENATKEWNRLAPSLVSMGLLTEVSLTPFGHLCALHGTIQHLYKAGLSPTGHMLAQYRGFCGEFGLTPASQGKVKAVHSDEKPANKFAKNKAKAA